MAALYEGKVQEQKGFQWRDGDEVIVCVEGAEVKTGNAAPYSNLQLRVVLGPLNDSKRDAGPYVRDDNTIGSRMLYDNASFSEKTKRRINAILFGVGHEGDVRIETDEDWLRAVLDREVKIRIKMEEYQGKDRPRPAAYVRPTLDEMRKVAAVYEEFGCARGYGWTEQPDTSLNPWDPAKYLGPQVQAAPGAQSRRNLQRPAPARDPAETRAIESDVKRQAQAGEGSQAAPEQAGEGSQVQAEIPLKDRLKGMTVAQIVETLPGVPADQLQALLEAEQGGRNRAKAVEAIQARMRATSEDVPT